jgi:hypothetical protein
MNVDTIITEVFESEERRRPLLYKLIGKHIHQRGMGPALFLTFKQSSIGIREMKIADDPKGISVTIVVKGPYNQPICDILNGCFETTRSEFARLNSLAEDIEFINSP